MNYINGPESITSARSGPNQSQDRSIAMTYVKIEPAYASVKPEGCYVYIHIKKSNGHPFYVGKGQDRRGWANTPSSDRNPKWINFANKNGVNIQIAQQGMLEADAFLLEMWLIAKLRHEGYDLCNMTDGGEGASGTKRTEIQKLRNAVTVFDSLGNQYPSLMDASRKIRLSGYPEATPGNIAACAKGRRTSMYGRAWAYDAAPDHPEITGRQANEYSRKRRVLRSDGIIFAGVREAGRAMKDELGTNCHYSGIVKAASGIQNTAFGYYWSYVED